MAEGLKQAEETRVSSADIPAKLYNGAFILAVIGGVGTAIGILLGIKDVWYMLVVNFVFWVGLAQGMFIWSTIARAAQATWAAGFNRIGQSAAAFLPLSVILFLIIWVGREYWLVWTWEHVPEKERWLNEPFFFWRNLIGLVLMSVLCLWYLASYRRLESCAGTDQEERAQGFLNKFSIWIIFAYVTVHTLLAFDVIMSLHPYWYSTLFGAYYFVGSQYAALAAFILVAAHLRKPLGLEKFFSRNRFSDMGNLMMGFCVLTTGFMFAQWLTVWYGNIPEEAIFVHPRLYMQPWESVGWVIFATAFVLPFLLLQFGQLKNNIRPLCYIAALVLFGMFVERWMLVVPSLSPERLAGLFNPLAWCPLLLCGGILVMTVTASLRKSPEVSSLDLALKLE